MQGVHVQACTLEALRRWLSHQLQERVPDTKIPGVWSLEIRLGPLRWVSYVNLLSRGYIGDKGQENGNSDILGLLLRKEI